MTRHRNQSVVKQINNVRNGAKLGVIYVGDTLVDSGINGEGLNSYMYAQIPGKGGAAKEVYDVVFNAEFDEAPKSVGRPT